MLREFLRRAGRLARNSKTTIDRGIDRYWPLIDRPLHRYYSDCKNDRWIVEKVFPGLRGGYFVEAGAANGVDGSSCYLLEKEMGWSGICIEPHPQFAEELRQSRPDSQLFQLCLDEREGVAEFVVGSHETNSAYLSGLRTNLELHKYGARETILRVGRGIPMSVLTLAQVLDQAGAPPFIDYGAFDIEGSEVPVLAAFPFERYRFRALSIECNQDSPLIGLLMERGYREVKNPYNRSQPWERYWLSD